jgi:hypothetical protein
MAQVVECLPSKCKALSSNPNIAKYVYVYIYICVCVYIYMDRSKNRN